MQTKTLICGLAVLFCPLGLPAAEPAPAAVSQADDERLSTAELVAQRNKYRALLPQTADAAERYRMQRLLADIELELASRADNPAPGARRALNIYHELLKYRSVDPERDAELLYRTAYAAELAGDIAGGIVALTRLIDNYSGTALLQEAYFRRAEMRFVYRNYGLAEDDYSWVIGHSRTREAFYLQSLFKRGWARYKQGKHSLALTDQLALLQHLLGEQGFNDDGSLNMSRISQAEQVLAEEALRNITLNFANLGNQLTPGEFTRNQNAERFYYPFASHLVDFYLEKQRYLLASEQAKAFARAEPEHPQAKHMEIQAISALESGGLNERALTAKQAFVERYALRRAPWYGQDPLSVPQAREQLQSYLDEIARGLHAAAQESGAPADYAAAAEWYAHYLTLFPDTPRASELAFLRGEALFEAGAYREAADAYERAAYGDQTYEQAAEAAYAALFAFRRAAGDNPTPDERDRIERLTYRFAQAYPGHPQAGAALAQLMEELFAADRLAEASEAADKVIVHQPPVTGEPLQNAYRIRAAAAMEAGDYARAEAAYRDLLGIVSEAERTDVEEALAASIYKRGEVLVDAGKDAAASDQFERVLELLPAASGSADDIRPVAAYDAATAAIRAGDKERGARLLAEFRETYPRHELADKVDERLAALYQELGYPDRALREFERISNSGEVDMATRREALLESAKLYAENGEYDAAVNAYKEYYYDLDPPLDESIEAQQSLVEIYVETGEKAKADFWRKRLIESHDQLDSERSRTLAAHAALSLADDARVEFESADLRQPLQRSLQAKKTRLQDALDAYSRAADYGIAEVTTAATYRIGELYYEFSQALLSAPLPEDLAGEDLEQYEVLLEEQAYPFEEKAIEILETNVTRIPDGIYNEWVEKSLARLAELQPARYAKKERTGDAIVALP